MYINMSLKLILFSYFVCCIYVLQSNSEVTEVTESSEDDDEFDYADVLIENPFILRVVDPLEEYVDYPAALINNDTVVTFSISGDIDGAIVCTAPDCKIAQPITSMEMYGDYMFWNIRLGADYQPEFFFDNITSDVVCTIGSEEVRLLQIETSDMYLCDTGCHNNSYEVLVCDNRLAGFITREDEADINNVKFHDIRSILDAGGYVIEDETKLVNRDPNSTKKPDKVTVFDTNKHYNNTTKKKITQRKTSGGVLLRTGIDCFLYIFLSLNFLEFLQ